MNINRKYIETIISANNDNSLAIFVGAGISKSSETKALKLPTWKDLIDALKDDLNIPHETDFLKIAQLYHLAFGEFIYYKKLKKFFPDNIPPSKIHKQIFDINPHVIITTNWDNILEKAIEENAYIYDLVSSDTDLVKSTLQNKLIKMHGDFKNHNLVFKEDDYIKYQLNFPLIENYIKSIISTHTVLFLGYSYSDIDLKQIVKWVQSHALDVRPPMYLVTYDHNANQIKYLENHGITTIIIEDINDDSLADPNLDEYAKKMHTFLSAIRQNNENNVLDDPEQIEKFVLRKIEHLDKLNGILIEQIQSALSNCGYLFDSDSKPILQFYNERLTTDNDKNTRSIYTKFIELLNRIDKGESPSDTILRIFEILTKARIKGILLSTNDINDDCLEFIAFSEHITIETDYDLDSLYNFNYNNENSNATHLFGQLDLVFKYYHLEKKEEAFSLVEDIIVMCLKQRNYMWLFIAMYNRNVLLDSLKYYSFKNWHIQKYSKYERYDLKDRYYNLTKDIRSTLEPIYQFIDFTFIYRYAYSASKDLKKIEDAKNTVQGGGVVLNNDIHKFSTRHENLVSFVLKNRLLIEDYEEYKSINKAFVNISLMRQVLTDIVSLTKTELYSCIKYFKPKDLQILFEDFYADRSEHKGKIQIHESLSDWLVEIVLENISEEYLKDVDDIRSFEDYLENTLFILSLLKHKKEHLDKIMTVISRIVKEGRNTIGIFECINLFFAIQHNLFSQEIDGDTLIELIETLITKLVYNKFNAHEFFSMTRNDLSNLYGYAQVQKVLMNNEVLINKLLLRIDDFSIEDKIDITRSLLFSLYKISTQPIKDKIKAFALNLDTTINDSEKDYKKLTFELALVIYGFKPLSKHIVSELNTYMEPYKSGTRFSSVLYTLKGQLEYLVNDKSIKELMPILANINDSITRHEQRDKMFII